MLKLQNYISFFVLFSVALFVAACSNTPNNVSIALNQGSCALPSQYSSSQLTNLESTYESYYTILINNPSTTTPYCTSVTIQNNNSGLNANNIQIINNGLQVSTTLPGSTTSTTAALYDTVAAGVTISGPTQNINNVVLFDPNNCATTTGANVQTLSAGGGSCTFYLEILNEANPVGVYPYYISYNYTNGNQNYNVNATLNQRVYLYGGDTRSPGLYYVPTNIMSTGTSSGSILASWQNGLTGSPSSGTVNYVIENAYGVIYFVSLSATSSTIYSYNGISINPVGTSLSAQVTSLAFDNNSNIYAATNGNGMWVYNIESSNATWLPMTDNNNNITSASSLIGLKGYITNNTIYAFSESKVYNCSVNGNTTESCTITNNPSGTPPNSFFTNSADVDDLGNLYTGSSYSNNTLGVSSINSSFSSWTTSTESPVIESSGNRIGGLRYTNNALYFGVVGSTESSVYNCNTSSPFTCGPTTSSSTSPITGNATTVTTDGVGNLYIAGYNLNSNDFGLTTLTTGAFLLFGTYAASSVGTWQTILRNSSTDLPANVSSVTVASMLTSY
jgi:hypothetical protein